MKTARTAMMVVVSLVVSSTGPSVRGNEAPAGSATVAEDRDPIPRPKGPASMSPAEVDGAIDRGRRYCRSNRTTLMSNRCPMHQP